MKKIIVIGLAFVAATAAACSGALKPSCKGKDCVGSDATRFANTTLMAESKPQVATNAPAITAKAAFLMEANSGKVLFAKDENTRLPIASMVKITTLAVIYDALESGQIKMSDKVMVSRNASSMGGSQAFLDFDNEYTVEDLVKSIVIASANDSCVAMAELIAGSETDFVVKMNELADRLGMENTNYANCTGLPAAESYSCAADVAKVYAHIMKSPFYAMFNKIWMYDLTHPSGRVTGLTNTNKHARFYSGCEGGKTGFTAEAGHCIAVTATRGSMRPLAVIVGGSDSKTRFAESANLMNFVFDCFENKLIVDAKQSVGTIKVKNASIDSVDVFPKANYYELIRKGDKVQPAVTVELSGDVKAPFKADTAIGKIVVTESGKVIKEVDIVAGQDVDGLKYWGAIQKISRNFKLGS